MHGWDLGAATGNSVEIPDEAIAFINALFEKIPEEMTRRPGVFGPAVASPDGANRYAGADGLRRQGSRTFLTQPAFGNPTSVDGIDETVCDS